MWDGRVDSVNDFFTYEIQPVDFRRLRKFKEIEALRGIQQNTEWHQEGDAYEHTKLVVNCMYNHLKQLKKHNAWYEETMLLVAIFHDVGKAVTTKYDHKDGLYHCPNHAEKSAEIFKEYNQYLTGSRYAEDLVRYHMQPMYILTSKDPKKAIVNLIDKCAPWWKVGDKGVFMRDLLRLKWCDQEGQINDKGDKWKEILENVKDLFNEIYPNEKINSIW